MMQALTEILTRLETEAKNLLAKPERFVLTSFDMEVRTERGNHQVIFNHDEWSCSCSEHEAQKICCHIIAAQRLLTEKSMIEGKVHNHECHT